MNEVTQKIDQLRHSRGWTIYRLAIESEVGEGTIRNWNSSNAYPLIPALKRICEAFGITLAEFFSDGKMIELTPELEEYRSDWMLLDKEERDAVQAIIKGYIKRKR